MFFEFYIQGETEIVADLLKLVEAFYSPTMLKEQDKLRLLRKESEKLQDQLKSYETYEGKLRSELSDQ